MAKGKKHTKLWVMPGVIFVLLLGLLYVPFTLRSGAKGETYAHVLEDAEIAPNTPVKDIAMLGAHDAFSSNINLASKPDPAESGILANKAMNAVFKGGLARVLKAQQDSAIVLLNRGVRYFDARISYVNDMWYTKHGLLDSELRYYLYDIYHFLAQNPSEFIIFDVQHIYLGDSSIREFIEYLDRLRFKDLTYGFTDFIHYTSAVPLIDLLYFDVLSSTRGGIIFLINDDGTATAAQRTLFYPREESIRSTWHNKRYVKDIVPCINAEAEFLNSEDELPYFRVNQAQLTPDYVKDPFGTLGRWSLINIAAQSNAKLLSNEDFDDWLSVMPIFMVDFANSKYNNFNTKINEKIIEYNRNLTT